VSAGREVEAVVEVFDYYDDTTGFSAMERTTGWHAAMMAVFAARGELAKGAVPVERAVTGKRILDECRARGMKIHQTVSPI
ncbi:MAG TPA: hypothetical protein VEC95_06880, partial [Terriglobales bacterium]|nr:hypothetical protein [Terriglobales bacterium]